MFHLAVNAGQLTCTCAFCATTEGPCFLPTGETDGSEVGQVLDDTSTTKEIRNVGSAIGKDIPARGDKLSTDCVDFSFFGKEVFQGQGPFLRG